MRNQRTNPLTWLAIALVVAIGLMAALGALAMGNYPGYYGMMGGGSWWWGIVIMAVPAVVLIIILVAALAGLGSPALGASGTLGTPLGILDQRYARGELTREDYLKIRDDLGRGPNHM